MGYACKILADSVSPAAHRLTTFEVTFPRIVLAELNTHRMLSRNSASSRATPVQGRIAAVVADPFVPDSFGRNRKGMQHAEVLEGDEDRAARRCWAEACQDAVVSAGVLANIGVHKQLANRLLEPFSWHTAVLTATDWSNFFGLRVNPAAQGEIRTIAQMMLDLYMTSEPTPVGYGEWHTPYVGKDERETFRAEGIDPVKVSVARCARVSTLTQDGRRDPREDVALYGRLVAPGHLSPLEHAARPMWHEELQLFARPVVEWNQARQRFEVEPRAGARYYLGNFNGWVQDRKLIPGEDDFLRARPASM